MDMEKILELGDFTGFCARFSIHCDLCKSGSIFGSLALA